MIRTSRAQSDPSDVDCQLLMFLRLFEKIKFLTADLDNMGHICRKLNSKKGLCVRARSCWADCVQFFCFVVVSYSHAVRCGFQYIVLISMARVNMPMMRLLSLAVAAAVALRGCAFVTPPPASSRAAAGTARSVVRSLRLYGVQFRTC